MNNIRQFWTSLEKFWKVLRFFLNVIFLIWFTVPEGLIWRARAVRILDLRLFFSKSLSISSWLTELEAILAFLGSFRLLLAPFASRIYWVLFIYLRVLTVRPCFCYLGSGFSSWNVKKKLLKFESKTSQKSKLCFISKLENSVGLNKNEKPFSFVGCVEYDKIDPLPNGFSLEKKTNLYAQLCKKKLLWVLQ